MRFAPILALVLAGPACVPLLPGEPAFAVPEGETRVVAARATPGELTLRLSDGTRCSALRPEGEAAGWSGVMADCPYALSYTVTFRAGGSPQRLVIEDPTFLPVGPDGAPAPRAEVFVTDVDGQRRLFVSPLGRDVQFTTAPPAS